MNRKEEIIYATLNLASEKGLGAISMNQIAEKIGISKPALYNHFSSKEELIKEMYVFLKEESKKSLHMGQIDYEALAKSGSLKEILWQAVENYKKICTNPQMFKFYKVIMSQRTIDKAAAEIMVMETKAMINATKTLFYALQAKGIACFKNIDTAALTFAMAVHSIIDFEYDLIQLNSENNEMMNSFISDFSNLYSPAEN